jgi:hypothetical protein
VYDYKVENMDLAICRHLPLITPHVEFTPQHRSDQPKITLRISLDHLVDSRSLDDEGDEDLTVDSDTEMTDSAAPEVESECDDGSDISTGSKIPKPPGEVGRPRCGGYNLETALGWREKTLEDVTVSLLVERFFIYSPIVSMQKYVHAQASKHLDTENSYSKQEQNTIKEICIRVSSTVGDT